MTDGEISKKIETFACQVHVVPSTSQQLVTVVSCDSPNNNLYHQRVTEANRRDTSRAINVDDVRVSSEPPSRRPSASTSTIWRIKPTQQTNYWQIFWSHRSRKEGLDNAGWPGRSYIVLLVVFVLNVDDGRMNGLSMLATMFSRLDVPNCDLLFLRLLSSSLRQDDTEDIFLFSLHRWNRSVAVRCSGSGGGFIKECPNRHNRLNAICN